jgi:hypothetical protein
MLGRQLSVVLLVLCAAGCAQPSQPPVAAVPPAPPPVAPAPPPSAAQIAPGVWDVDRARCGDLLGASDDDRAAAAMFYYGYLAARTHIHVIYVSRIDTNIEKVMNVCAGAPNITVTSAFYRALRPGRWQ